jgi:DNA-directed RNA polymerase subunit RPC12/RpoP
VKQDEEIICPKCGSTNVNRDKVSVKAFAISVLLLGFPLLFFKKGKYHCFECGNDFKPEKKKIPND